MNSEKMSANDIRGDTMSICNQPLSECNDCGLSEVLMCKYEVKDTIIFLIPFLIAFIPAIIGIILSGYGLWLIAYFGFLIFFFIVWENRILCSHCPYYAEEGKTLRCHANYGLPKTWNYHPEPLSRSEQIQFLIGVLIIVGFPMPFLIIGEQYLMLTISVVGVILWLCVLQLRACKKCINFSCPLNRIPKKIVDEYLKHNKVMRNAWEKTGYRIAD